MLDVHLSVGEVNLILEALEHRASRHESYARSDPRNAGPHERVAADMRTLRDRIKSARTTRLVGPYLKR
jgi:hypothetical protein